MKAQNLNITVNPLPVVYVIDDDAGSRNALSWLLESINLNVQTFELSKQCLDALHPDMMGCIISDVRMPEISGLEFQKQLRDKGILLPVILITGFADIHMAVSALKDGAYDFLEKPYHDQSVIDSVQAALASNQKQKQSCNRVSNYLQRLESLTGREQHVVELIIDGKTNSEAADALDIGIRAIETYRSNAMTKMKAKSLANLVYMCIQANNNSALLDHRLAS